MNKKKVVFIGGALDHTNLPLCYKLFEHYKDDFLFIATEKEYADRKALNYDSNKKLSFVLDAADKCDFKLVRNICYDADILIYGGVSKRQYIRKRLRSKKITFKLTERFFKNGKPYSLHSILGIILHYYSFTQKNKYVLCMGGFVPNDLDKYSLFKNNRFKWGYFTDGSKLSFNGLEIIKNHPINILWVGRFIDVKQPFSVIELAKFLNNQKINCEITMVGYGELLEKCKQMCDDFGISNKVKFTGAINLDEKEKLMDYSNIFIFTSTSGEGWGAVVNEAMSSGCLTIGTTLSGSSSALIKNGVNGFLYNPASQEDLNYTVLKCINSYTSFSAIRKNAFNTIHDLWNINVATERLISIFESLLNGKEIPHYEDGPCSMAMPIK